MINLYRDWQLQPDVIYYGDSIWLHHLEFNSSFITGKGADNTYIVSMLYQHQNNIEWLGNTNGIWVIEHADFRTGGPV